MVSTTLGIDLCTPVENTVIITQNRHRKQKHDFLIKKDVLCSGELRVEAEISKHIETLPTANFGDTCIVIVCGFVTLLDSVRFA